jgi:hypothetical protein
LWKSWTESFVFNDVTKSYASLMTIDTGSGNGVDEDNDTGNSDNCGDAPEPGVTGVNPLVTPQTISWKGLMVMI